MHRIIQWLCRIITQFAHIVSNIYMNNKKPPSRRFNTSFIFARSLCTLWCNAAGYAIVCDRCIKAIMPIVAIDKQCTIQLFSLVIG